MTGNDKISMGLPLALQFRISSYRSYDEGNNQFVLYDVVVKASLDTLERFNGNKKGEEEDKAEIKPNDKKGNRSKSSSQWIVSRRFSDFAALDDYLHDRFANTPKFPAKTFTRSFECSFLEKRMHQLEDYLNRLSKRRDIMSCGVMHGFVRLKQNYTSYFEEIPSSAQYDCVSPCTVLTLPPFKNPIFQLIFSECSDTLLVGCAASTWTTKVDAFFSNFISKDRVVPTSSQICSWSFKPNGEVKNECIEDIGQKVTAMCVTDDCSYVYVGMMNGDILCYHIHNFIMKPVETNKHLPFHNGPVSALAWYGMEKLLISGGSDGFIKIYSTKSHKHEEIACAGKVTTLALYPEARQLFVGCDNGTIESFGVSNHTLEVANVFGKEKANAGEQLNSMVSMACMQLDTANNKLYTGGADKRVSIWNLKMTDRSQALSLCEPRIDLCSEICSMALITLCNELCCGCKNGSIVVISPIAHAVTFCFDAHEAAVNCMHWHDEKGRLFTGGKDKLINIWNLYRFDFDDGSESSEEPAESPGNCPATSIGTPLDMRQQSPKVTARVELSNMKQKVNSDTSKKDFRVDPLLGIVVNSTSRNL